MSVSETSVLAEGEWSPMRSTGAAPIIVAEEEAANADYDTLAFPSTVKRYSCRSVPLTRRADSDCRIRIVGHAGLLRLFNPALTCCLILRLVSAGMQLTLSPKHRPQR